MIRTSPTGALKMGKERMAVADFLPGLELNRRFYQEAIEPILAARFPGLVYSAALIGYGSDVLGYDTALSTDHEWGPRGLFFLREDDYSSLAPALADTLRRELPATFLGYSTHFGAADSSGIRSMTLGEQGRIEHHVELHTVRSFLMRELGVEPDAPLAAQDWLTFPEQRLLQVTAGAVYHDGLDALAPLRERFAYYPDDVWRYRLAAQWLRISQEEAFMGRCGEVGDDLGSRVVAARLSRDLMRLCFLQTRQYAPYSKWLGTAFARLPGAEILGPYLAAALNSATWEEREHHLVDAYELLATWQNELEIAAFQDPHPRSYYERPYQVIHAERFANALANVIQDAEVQRIIASVGLIGGIDQFVDSTDVLTNPPLFRQFGSLFGV